RSCGAGGAVSVAAVIAVVGPHRAPCRTRRRTGMSVPLVAGVLLADDHAVVRRGLQLVLEAEPALSVVAEAGDGAEAVDAVAEHDIDLAVLDVAMPRLTGLQA